MDFIEDVGKVGHFGETTQIVLLFLFTFGFAKAGLMPLHSWLPGAMVAPTPVLCTFACGSGCESGSFLCVPGIR